MASINGILYTGDDQQFMDALVKRIEELERQLSILSRSA